MDGYDEGNGVFCYYSNMSKICYIAVNEIILAPSCKFIIRMSDWLTGDSAATLPLGTRETGCGFPFCVRQVNLSEGQFTYQTNNKKFLHIPTKELVEKYA